jgi:integrase
MPPTAGESIAKAGMTANEFAAAGSFQRYISLKAENTIHAQFTDLATFSQYLVAIGLNRDHCPSALELQTRAVSWSGITWGLVEGFVRWLLAAGYSIGSINRKLSTVKIYAKLAAQSNVISADELALIRNVSGYSVKEGKRIDQKRANTRIGEKKQLTVMLTNEQAQRLKVQPQTPQGRRDGLVMCLLLDHGLRVGELASLQVTDFDVTAGTFTFYRNKVDVTQTHRMTPDTQKALSAWLEMLRYPDAGSLLRASRKGGLLTTEGLTERAITARVRTLGEQIGVAGLSAHDCRHYWATRAAEMGTDSFALRDAGGWKSMAMPARYVEAAKISNERVKL